ERPDERLDATADGWVGDAELTLHVAQVAARAEEALEQRELLAGQAPEPPDAELTLEGGPAGAAVEARDGELAGADGTSGVEVGGLGVPWRSLRVRFVGGASLARCFSLCQDAFSLFVCQPAGHPHPAALSAPWVIKCPLNVHSADNAASNCR